MRGAGTRDAKAPPRAGFTGHPALRHLYGRMSNTRRRLGCITLLLAGSWSILWGGYALTLAPVASGVSSMSQEALALTAEVIAEAEQESVGTARDATGAAPEPTAAAAGGPALDRRLVACGVALLAGGLLALVVAVLRLLRRARRVVWVTAAVGLSAELVWLTVIGTGILPALARSVLFLLGGILAGLRDAPRPATQAGAK